MPPRKSDLSRRSDPAASSPASAPVPAFPPPSASSARFAPIGQQDDDPAARAFAMQPSPAMLGSVLAPPGGPSAAVPTLTRPPMDTASMPPPSLPPHGAAAHHQHHAPDPSNVNVTPRPGAAVASAARAAAFSQITPSSEKGKDKEEGKTGPGGHPKEAITIPIEELQLPRSIITRLAKGVLPPNTQIQSNAILAMTKSATVFINHLASAANEVTALQNKKTIMPADVFRALDDIEYGFMRERVEAEFARFNETQTTKRSAYRKKVAVSKKGPKGPGEGGGDGATADTDGDTAMGGADTAAHSAASATGGSQHRAKKARTDAKQEAMDVDDEEPDASDPESVPNEEDDDEEPQEDEDEDEDGQDAGENEGDQDELEEREDRVDDDEALDDGNHSD